MRFEWKILRIKLAATHALIVDQLKLNKLSEELSSSRIEKLRENDRILNETDTVCKVEL